MSYVTHGKIPNHSNRKSRNKEQKKQTGTDRNRQDYISNIENYCIIIIAL